MTDADTILAEHARGDSLRTIGKRHGVSHETARRLVLERGSQLIADLAYDLQVAERCERQGLTAEWPTYLIPFQAQADWQDALAMFDWTVKQLRARGFRVEIVSRTTPAGMALMVTVPRCSGSSEEES